MLTRQTKFLFGFLAIVLIMACAPTLTSAPPAAPTLDPLAINRIIAQTANAASTQTAVAMPTSTQTEPPTQAPSSTASVEPTITSTFIYIYTTPTNFVIPAFPNTFSPTSNRDYACEVIDSPLDGTIYSPRKEFKVRWRLKNVGRREWDSDSVDFVYDTGDKFHKVSEYDLGESLTIGYVAEFFVDMQAPKDPGTYTTYWALRIGTEKFCKVSLTIGVR